ncbi:MAG: septal ring lytic transglycosylase RlpA family protein [Actinomycetota bacterium]
MAARRTIARVLLLVATLPLLMAAAPVPARSEEMRARVWVSPANLIEGESARVEGRVRDARLGSVAIIQQRASGRWKTIARTSVQQGRFGIGFVPKQTGPGVVRALIVHRRERVETFGIYTLFRRTEATWYGPGFFGNFTACGQRFDENLVGVAHRSLPCGTPVTFFYGGTLLTVPVVDRGPYGTADWDLTAETARILGFTGRQTLGVLIASEPGE